MRFGFGAAGHEPLTAALEVPMEARAVTFRFPDGDYQIIVGLNVPVVGEKMRIQGKDWSVAAVTRRPHRSQARTREAPIA